MGNNIDKKKKKIKIVDKRRFLATMGIAIALLGTFVSKLFEKDVTKEELEQANISMDSITEYLENQEDIEIATKEEIRQYNKLYSQIEKAYESMLEINPGNVKLDVMKLNPNNLKCNPDNGKVSVVLNSNGGVSGSYDIVEKIESYLPNYYSGNYQEDKAIVEELAPKVVATEKLEEYVEIVRDAEGIATLYIKEQAEDYNKADEEDASNIIENIEYGKSTQQKAELIEKDLETILNDNQKTGGRIY